MLSEDAGNGLFKLEIKTLKNEWKHFYKIYAIGLGLNQREKNAEAGDDWEFFITVSLKHCKQFGGLIRFNKFTFIISLAYHLFMPFNFFQTSDASWSIHSLTVKKENSRISP